MQRAFARLIRHYGFILAGKGLALALFAVALQGKVVAAQNHVLRGFHNRLAALRLKYVIGCKHEEPCFRLRFNAERNVHGHLVAVEVRVECGTYQRVQLYGAAFNKDWLERLYTKAVQRRRAVEHNGMLFYDHFQLVPYLCTDALYHALCALYVVRKAVINKLLHYEGLEQLQRHFLGQTALIHLQLRAYDYNASAGIVNALAQQVLPEAALLTPKHIGKGLERPVAGAGNGASAAAVIDKGVHRFLKHTLFVAHYNVRRVQLKQPLEAVISVYNPAVKVVKVAGGEPAAVKLNHRPQFRRNYRHRVQYYPFGLVAALKEGFNNVQPLYGVCALLAGGGVDLVLKLLFKLLKVKVLEQFLYGFGAHAGLEGLGAVFVLRVAVFLVAENLLILKRCVAGIGNYKRRKVQHFFKVSRAHVQQHLHAAGYALEIPYV